MTGVRPSPATEAGAASDSRRRRPSAADLVALLALIPAAIMLRLVLESSQLPWYDYWRVLGIFTASDGSLRPLDLLFYHEGHVAALPSFVLWLNYQLTGGLAHAIGYFVVAVGLAQVVLVRQLLPAPPAWDALTRSLVVVAVAVLIFAPQGAWNFSRSASGASWLTANLLALAAIACATRGRVLWIIPFAGLASISYGTGLMAWPAAIAVLALRGWPGRRAWIVVAAAAVTFVTYLATRPPGANGATAGFEPNDIARRALQVLGSVLSPDPQVAPLLGALGVALAGFLAVECWRRPELRAAALPFIGLAAYAIMAAGLIGLARGGLHDDDLGVASRYASLPALLWSAVLVLLILRFRPDPRAWAAAFLVAALGFTTGQPTLASMRTASASQDELAIAIRLGLSGGYTYGPSPERLTFVRAIGHYPFTDSFDADCGRIGTRVDRASIQQPKPGTGGHLDRFEQPLNAESVRVSGWFGSRDGRVECVLITDDSLEVIGASAVGIERPDVALATPTGAIDLGFVGVAPSGEDEYRAFAIVDGQDRPYAIPGTLEPTPPEEPEPDEQGG